MIYNSWAMSVMRHGHDSLLRFKKLHSHWWSMGRLVWVRWVMDMTHCCDSRNSILSMIYELWAVSVVSHGHDSFLQFKILLPHSCLSVVCYECHKSWDMTRNKYGHDSFLRFTNLDFEQSLAPALSCCLCLCLCLCVWRVRTLCRFPSLSLPLSLSQSRSLSLLSLSLSLSHTHTLSLSRPV